MSRIAKWGERVLNFTIGLLLLSIVLLTLAQIFWRYVVGSSFTWSEELNLLFWAWMIALAAIKARHLRISMLVSAMPMKVQIVLYSFRILLTLTLLAVLFWYGLNMVALTANDTYVELDFMSRKWLFMSIPVAAVPWAVVSIARYIHAVRELSAGRDPMIVGLHE